MSYLYQHKNKKLFHKFILCSFSMMVKWANDGLLQANATKILVNDGEMLVNDGEMSVEHILISPSMTSISPSLMSISLSLTSISPSLTSILLAFAWSKPLFAHLTIIEKLHRLKGVSLPSKLIFLSIDISRQAYYLYLLVNQSIPSGYLTILLYYTFSLFPSCYTPIYLFVTFKIGLIPTARLCSCT